MLGETCSLLYFLSTLTLFLRLFIPLKCVKVKITLCYEKLVCGCSCCWCMRAHAEVFESHWLAKCQATGQNIISSFTFQTCKTIKRWLNKIKIQKSTEIWRSKNWGKKCRSKREIKIVWSVELPKLPSTKFLPSFMIAKYQNCWVLQLPSIIITTNHYCPVPWSDMIFVKTFTRLDFLEAKSFTKMHKLEKWQICYKTARMLCNAINYTQMVSIISGGEYYSGEYGMWWWVF